MIDINKFSSAIIFDHYIILVIGYLVNFLEKDQDYAPL